VLAALCRHGADVAYSCQAGACHACLLRAVAGDPGAPARQPLRDTLQAQGYFLACQSRPTGDLTVTGPDGGDGAGVPAVFVSARTIGPRVLLVRLRTAEPLDYRAGQYVTLLRGDDPPGQHSHHGERSVARSYSLAGRPGGRELVLHVAVRPGGRMSGWLAGAAPGAPLEVRGPAGHCFYLPGRPDQPLLLAGTGTGIAPLAAIARDALRHGHTGPVTLLHGAGRTDGLYLDAELSALAAAHPAVRYRTAVRDRGEDLLDLALATVDASASRIFLCGGEEVVRRLRRALFLAGARLADIHADAFLPSRTLGDLAATER
jgi:CDP-4-dehydro-6-deoxyglucose reductase, E3